MLNAQCCLFLCSDILIEDTEGEGLRGNASPLRNDFSDNKVQYDPQSHKEVNKDLSKVTTRWSTSQPGNKTPNTAKIGEAKSPLIQNNPKTTGVAAYTAAATSKMDTPSRKILTLPSTMHIPAPEMITTPPRISPPPLEMTMPKPKMSTPPPKLETITPSQKIVPPIPVTKSTTKTTPKITQAPVPFKATVSSSNTTTIQTSVSTGSTTLVTNQKIQGLWTAPVTTTSPTLVTSMSNNLPRFNVTDNTAPPSSVHSLQKASLGVPIKSPQSPVSETVDSQPDSPITKPMPRRDELLSPKTIRPPVTSLVTSMPNSPPESTATEDVAPSHKLRKVMNAGAPVATAQNIDKPSTNAATTTLATKLSTLSPPTLSAATSFLKHVYSCPDSLQR